MIKTCSLGHPYDSQMYSECPWCRAGAGEEGQPHEPYPPHHAESMQPQGASTRGERREEGKTVIFSPSGSGESLNKLIDPVVGWLVCYEGLEKGRDYRVHIGQNAVGRDDNMDIVLKDNAISRNGHCFLTYDHKHNAFVIHSGISHGTVYRNGHLVAGSEELLSFDTLELGDSKFLFVALCGEHFRWE